MSPVIHGRMYPEIESSALMSYTLRVLIDPVTVREHARTMLDLDTLRVYLRDVKSPCGITLLLPAKPDDSELDAVYEFMQRIEVEVLPSSVVVASEAAAVFPEAPRDSEALALASTAWFADADIVVSERMVTHGDLIDGFRKLHIHLVDVQGAKRACEVFVRGHEIPWSFRSPAWLMPWTPFYTMVDEDIRKMEEFRGLAARKGVSLEVQERIRALGLNRWSAIAYTRDKLLFYMVQRRRAKRHKLDKQEYTFELAYHLTVYSLLFWGVLDQISWIVSEISALGFRANEWRIVGVAKKKYLNRLREHDPTMMAIFQEPEFLRWVDVLRRARHYVAHQGIAMLSPLFEKPAHEPSQAEIDREIEGWGEWRELAKRWPVTMMEAIVRPNFRAKWYTRNYRQISDAAFVLRDPTEAAIIFPLENIEWEYEQCRKFTLDVAARCSAILTERPDVEHASQPRCAEE